MTVSDEILREGLSKTLEGTDFPSLGQAYHGKVRDNYTKDGKRYIVVTDRGHPIATMLPYGSAMPPRALPDREREIGKLPRTPDSASGVSADRDRA